MTNRSSVPGPIGVPGAALFHKPSTITRSRAVPNVEELSTMNAPLSCESRPRTPIGSAAGESDLAPPSGLELNGVAAGSAPCIETANEERAVRQRVSDERANLGS